MKLYLLRPRDDKGIGNWDPWYDKSFGFVIRAKNEKRAREIADENAGDENRDEFMLTKTSDEKHPWMNPDYSSCTKLVHSGDEGMIMMDFRSA